MDDYLPFISGGIDYYLSFLENLFNNLPFHL